MCFVCCTDFYDICDEVNCAGPSCPESDCRCARGTLLGPDGQTCLGETDREGGREGTDKLCSRQRLARGRGRRIGWKWSLKNNNKRNQSHCVHSLFWQIHSYLISCFYALQISMFTWLNGILRIWNESLQQITKANGIKWFVSFIVRFSFDQK